MMWTVMDSPVGELRIIADGGAITAIEFSPFDGGRVAQDERDDDAPLLVAAREQLAAYFAGERREFDLPLAPKGTEFQQRVWAQLRLLSWGETASYGEVAHRLEMTNAASRAIGLANGQNPIPIVIGCHRVIGANGSLTGYAGGLDRKRTLLDLESSSQQAMLN